MALWCHQDTHNCTAPLKGAVLDFEDHWTLGSGPEIIDSGQTIAGKVEGVHSVLVGGRCRFSPRFKGRLLDILKLHTKKNKK